MDELGVKYRIDVEGADEVAAKLAGIGKETDSGRKKIEQTSEQIKAQIGDYKAAIAAIKNYGLENDKSGKLAKKRIEELNGEVKRLSNELVIVDNNSKKAKTSVASFGQVAAQLGAALAGLSVIKSVIGAFSAASARATELEKSFLRLESSARAFGQSGDKAKEAALDLSKNGFATLEQNAKSLSNLFAAGLNIDQSKSFIRATQDIAAFGNTAGFAAESVVEVTKAILTNSSEVIENASPALKEINSRYQENIKTIGKAAAVQQLHTEVLELSNKFTGDAAKLTNTYDGVSKKLSITVNDLTADIGTQIQEAFKPLLEVLLVIVKEFAEWFAALDGTSKKILIFGSALILIIPSLVGVAKGIFGVVTALRGMQIAAALALGPVGLLIAAIALLTAGALLYNESSKKQQYKRETAELAQLQRQANLTAREKQRLLELDKKYPTESQFLRTLRAENFTLQQGIGLINQRNRLQAGINDAFISRLPTLSDAELETAARNLERTLQQNRQELERLGPDSATRGRLPRAAQNRRDAVRGTQSSVVIQTERLTQLRAEQEARLRNAPQSLPIFSGAGGSTTTNVPTREIKEFMKMFAETAGEAVEIETEQIRREMDAQRQSVRDNSLRGSEEFIREMDRLNRIEKERIVKVELDAFRDRIDSVSEGIKAIQAGDIGGAVSGAGGLIGGSFGGLLGGVGGAFSAVSGLVGTLKSVFGGESPEDRKRREIEEQQRQMEELQRQSRLLEEQISLQSTLVALQRERDKATIEGLELQKRINTLTLSPEEAQSANRALVESQLSEFGGGVQTLAGSGTAFEAARRREIDLKELQARIDGLSEPGSIDRAGWESYISTVDSFIVTANQKGLSELLPSLTQLRSLGEANRSALIAPPGQTQIFVNTAQQEQRAQQAATERLRLSGLLGADITSIQSDITDVDEYLSLLEEQKGLLESIETSTGKTAENTALQTRSQRALSVVDVGRRIINSLGNSFIDPRVTDSISRIQTPSAIQSMALATSAGDAFKSRVANGVDSMVRLQTEANRLLSAIAAALDNNDSTNPLDAQSLIMRVLNDAKRSGANI